MPLDGNTYQPKMSLEEQALRNADAFFTGSGRWHKGSADGPNGSLCLGRAVIIHAPAEIHKCGWRSVASMLGLDVPTSEWNDEPERTYADIKALLRSAIARYEHERMGELVS